ncbi:hypothetical protein ABH923_003327 [Leifsonia sp. EB41]
MLDLETGVDLQEGHRAVLADQELAGACALVADLLEDGLGCAVELVELLRREERCGRLLHQLLVAALQRAVAGGDHDDVAVGVREALRLDVARLVEVLLHEALAATERGDGLAGGGVEELGDLVAGAGDLEAATAAAERRLDGDREAVLVHEVEHLGRVGDRVEGAGGERRADLLGDVAGRHLVAEALDGLRGRADPGQAGRDDRAGEVGVLGQEAVAGVDCVGAGAARDREDLVDDQVGLGAGRALEGVRLVGEPHVEGVAILVGVDGDGADPAVFRSTDDADGDLAAVGDEDLRDTGHNSLAYAGSTTSFWTIPTKMHGRSFRESTNDSDVET